jgi:AraC-like DNA-binding protein
MSDEGSDGVLFAEHSTLRAMTPIASLWSYRRQQRERGRHAVTLTPNGTHEYWLDRSDPLLNTILPGTHVSLIVNLGDAWATGRSLATSALLPPIAVVGPITRSLILRIGRSVSAIGVVLPPTMSTGVFGVPACDLVDQIVSLQELWAADDIERLLTSLSRLDTRHRLTTLRDALLTRTRTPRFSAETTAGAAAHVIAREGGRVSIRELARAHGLSHRQFTTRFVAGAGLSPKMFARITRFQRVVHALLSTDVSRWASVAPAVGFYDQAHMINEFRAFAGSAPTAFFRPHDSSIDATLVQIRGRPSEWLRQPPSDRA